MFSYLSAVDHGTIHGLLAAVGSDSPVDDLRPEIRPLAMSAFHTSQLGDGCARPRPLSGTARTRRPAISSSERIAAALEQVLAAYESGDTAGAVDGFLRDGCGEGYRAVLERVLPDAFSEALARLTCSSRRRCLPYRAGPSGPAIPSA
jgi:hypothetical protein